MKIEFDKALLWLVPYLYLVSILYYLGYWGTFSIDAFNYYELSDLVKGIVAVLGLPMLYVLLICFTVFIGVWITDDTVKLKSLFERRKAKALLVAGIIFIISAIILYAFFGVNDTKTKVSDSNGMFLLMKIALLSISLTFSVGLAVELSTGKVYKSFASTLCTVSVLTLLPCNAFVTGKNNAFKILQGKEYDYVLVDSLAGPHPEIYKYLGKAGSYYILINLKNDKRIAVSTDRLNPLLIERLSLDDSASVRKLEIHRRVLEGLVK